jgi:O-antigen/teichoic acid export membrane protein
VRLRGVPNLGVLSFVALATTVANVSAYLLSALASKLLPTSEFAIFTVLLSISIVAGAVGLAFQAVSTRATVTKDSAPEQLLGASIYALMALLVLGFLISFPLGDWLNIEWYSIAIIIASVAISIPGFTSMGIAQGRENPIQFGLMYGALGIIRATFGILFMFEFQTARSGAIGTLVGSLVGTLVILIYLREPIKKRGGIKAISIESNRALVAILGLIVFANLDVPLSRILLAEEESNVYAAGALISKVAFFLPSFVLYFLLGRLSQANPSRTLVTSVLSTLSIGVIAIVSAAIFRDAIGWFFDSPDFALVEDVAWIFALQGSLFALLQVLVYAKLAQRDPRAISVIWFGLAAYAVTFLVISVTTLQDLLAISIIATAIISLVSLVATFRTTNQSQLTE